MATPETVQSQVCYRHPGRETAVSCSNCGRPICPDCMVYAAVGIKCPECAGQPSGARKTARRVRSVGSEGRGEIVTKVLVGSVIGIFLLQLLESSGSVASETDELFQRGSLVGGLVAEGEWWRLVTSAFLHANLLHIFFNALMLWWFGRPLELLLGRVRFAGIFVVSVLAGAAGALLLTAPFEATLGASGGVFGILGAGLVLERSNVQVFGGAALLVVAFNLALTFVLSSVSIGGHVGGLVGGGLAMFALAGFGTRHAVYGRIGLLGAASLVGIAVGSVVLAYLAVNGHV